jgi:hypothetical protein
MTLPKIAGANKAGRGRAQRPSKANKNIGIRRAVSPLRDQHAKGRTTEHPVHPPSAPRHPEESGNRYGK